MTQMSRWNPTPPAVPELTDEEAAQPITRGDANVFSAAVLLLVNKFKWTFRLTVAVCIATIMSLTAGTAVAYVLLQVRDQQEQLRADERCVAVLAAANAGRTGVLAPLALEKQDAQDARDAASAVLINSIIPVPGRTEAEARAEFTRDLTTFHALSQAYDRSNDAYKEALKENPPPKTSTASC